MTQYKKKEKTQHIFHYSLLIILTIFIIVPFLLGFWTSLLPTADISKGALWSNHISLDNYVTAI
ncbi:MAG: carbohydrate ABC transporter permease, partial [Liquorilactobacillus hordei]